MKTKQFYFTTITVLLTMLFLSQRVSAQRSIMTDGNGPIPVSHQDITRFTVVDTAKLIVTYSLRVSPNPDGTKKSMEDVRVLEIGGKISKTYSKRLYEGDSVFFAHIRKGARAARWFQEAVPAEVVYKNYPQDETTVAYRVFGVNTVHRYKEPFPFDFGWKLSHERKRILSYDCQKAVCTFRGREYTAWFTPDIPLKDGPYKFSGLPGLILEISDSQQNYVYTCIGIQQPKNIVPITFWKWKYEDVTREKLHESLKKIYKSPAVYLQGTGQQIFIKRGNDFVDGLKVKDFYYPYNPIELE